MTTQGVSTKLTMSIIGVQGILELGRDADNRFAYACLIALIVIAFKAAQVLSSHWNKPIQNGKEAK